MTKVLGIITLLLSASLAACSAAPGVQDEPRISISGNAGPVSVEVYISGNGTGGSATASPATMATVPVSAVPGL